MGSFYYDTNLGPERAFEQKDEGIFNLKAQKFLSESSLILFPHFPRG